MDDENNYEDILEILYPGYSKMSEKKKELIQMRSYDIIGNVKEIKALISEMKNPESSLYQPNTSDKDLIYMANLYAKAHNESKIIRKPTGKVVRGGDYYDKPINEYQTVKATDAEQKQLYEKIITSYNEQSPIKAKSLINMLSRKKTPEINLNSAMEAKKVLDNLEISKETDSPEREDTNEESR